MSKKPATDAKSSARWRMLLATLLIVGFASLVLWPRGGSRPLPLPEKPVVSMPLSRTAPALDGTFTRLSVEESGVDHLMPIDEKHPQRYLYSWAPGGGVAIGDLDNDGLPDLFLVNGPGENRVYRQIGNLKFENVSAGAGIDVGEAWGTGVTLVDIDNDGRLDIYVCNYDAPNQLFINQGGFHFRERSYAYHLNLHDASMLGTFADYDRDGDLDLYLLTYRFERPQGRPRENPVIQVNGQRQIHPRYQKFYMVTDDDWGYDPAPRADGLLRNNGDGTFTDVSESAGIGGLGHGLSATWWDYNEDGWPDVYVANDFMDADQLFCNNRDGTFTDVIAATVPHTTWFSMGADVADLNHDGHLDLLVADMSATSHYKQKMSMGDMGKNRLFLETAVPRQTMRNTLLLNTGTSRMMEVAYLAGLASSDWTWTVKLADLNNDGRDDVYFTNGSPRDFTNPDVPFHRHLLSGKTNWDLYADTPERREKNLAFENLGEMQFADVSDRWGLGHAGISMAAAHADLDRDGDLDLVVCNLNEPVAVYRNDLASGNGLLLRLHGTTSNRYGIGARVEIEADGVRQVKQLQPVTGFLSSNEPLLHFGLAASTQVDRVTIKWPNGMTQQLTDLGTNQLYTIVEPSEGLATESMHPVRREAARSRSQGTDRRMVRESLGVHASPQSLTTSATRQMGITAVVEQPIFERISGFDGAQHHERDHDDYERQPLLPYKLSQLGPGLSCGDVDGDGDIDLYLGGAAGQSGMLIIQHQPGKYRRVDIGAFQADREHEDMASLWFDVDADEDLDLYVVSGSYEFDPQSKWLADRLYVNDGNLQFRRASGELLPTMLDSGSVVAAADYDRDGDLDLFVGGRLCPGAYPVAATCRLLRNDAGKLVDVADQVLDGSPDLGLVTSALWSDVNDDGWADLWVTTEWGPVRCFINEQAQLVEATNSLGLNQWRGWWNGITGCDVDHDGDIDYVVTNLGLNSKYHASPESPALLYYGDFTGDGQKHLVEAEYELDTLFPMRGKSCSTNAMPHLADKFKSFHSFALASLEDIFTPACLDDSLRLEATEFRTGVLINGGERFEFHPLGWQVQASPGFGCVMLDVDGDRHQDLVIVQNFFGPQPETGRMDGGLGVLLRGSAEGRFHITEPEASGLIIPQDAKSLIAFDLDGDARRDLVVGVNDGAPLVFRNRSHPPGRRHTLRLVSSSPNSTCVGASVRATYDDGLIVVKESYAGGGYLSQGTADFEIVVPADRTLTELHVRWPDGRETSHRDLDASTPVWKLAAD